MDAKDFGCVQDSFSSCKECGRKNRMMKSLRWPYTRKLERLACGKIRQLSRCEAVGEVLF